MCAAVSRRKADGKTFQMESFVVPMQMCWSFMQFQESLPTIGSEAYVDIGYLSENNSSFVISLLATPGNFKGYVGRNDTVRYKFVAEAVNQIKSQPLFIEISWNGKFHFDKEEMVKHLVIKVVKCLG